MSMNLPVLNAPALLREHGLHANKGLGQNFLDDPSALESIIRAASIQPQDTVLEIGPGLGSLTRYLALSAREVTAVELDDDLIPILQTVLAPYPNVRVIAGDILKLSPSILAQSDDYLVVANVPYYITSAIFRHLLAKPPRPRRMVLTIQKEVAERICARPGDMSLLSLSVQVYGEPRIEAVLPAKNFFPAPLVDSAIIRVDMYPQPRIAAELLDAFFHVIKAGFSQKRKTLRNALSAGLRLSPGDAGQLLEGAGIDPMRRAETLSIEEWSVLTAHYAHSLA
jgi:16S rRNA (adenine1518-N6/adenine1519-N6)-dimethyltransferase